MAAKLCEADPRLDFQALLLPQRPKEPKQAA